MKQIYRTVSGSLLIVFLLLTCIPLAYAQHEADNLAKYWQYRNAYKKQFIVIGENQGQCIPLATVLPNEDISWDGLWSHHQAFYSRPSGNGAFAEW
jgi:hypothetical protein